MRVKHFLCDEIKNEPTLVQIVRNVRNKACINSRVSKASMQNSSPQLAVRQSPTGAPFFSSTFIKSVNQYNYRRRSLLVSIDFNGNAGIHSTYSQLGFVRLVFYDAYVMVTAITVHLPWKLEFLAQTIHSCNERVMTGQKKNLLLVVYLLCDRYNRCMSRKPRILATNGFLVAQ